MARDPLNVESSAPEPHAQFRNLIDSLIDHLRQQKADGLVGLPLTPIARMALEELSRPLTSTSRAIPETKPFRPAPNRVEVSVAPVRPVSRPSDPPAPSSTPPLAMPSQAESDKTTALPTPPLSRSAAEKEAAMASLRERVLGCMKCPHLASSRKSVVFGVGNVHSPLLFVGEAPGADEDEQGEPFVGRAGQLLTKIIQAMGLSRQDVFIANILKCRPDTPGQTAGNRKPTMEEMQTCMPHLLEQIDIIQPKVIVALGATAVEGLLGKTLGITRLRGQWQSFHSTPVMPTYHPAYLLRNQALSEKRKVWEDMLKVMDRLQMPVSEKQRGFFLQAAG